MNLYMRRSAALLASTLSWIALSDASYASEESELPPADEYQDTRDENGNLITVTATRNPIRSFDYPGQVAVVDRDLILDFNPSTIGEIFDAIPNAQFDSGPRRTGDAPTIRGLTGNGVLIFLDGARQSFVSGHDGRFFVDPELVKSVELVRGPASALYGSGALGGVISTQTITARDYLGNKQFGYRISSGFQSVNDEFRVGASAAWQSDNGMFDVIGNLTYRESGSIALGNGLDLPAEDQIYSSLAKLTIRPVDNLELYASYIRYNADSTDPQNPQGVNISGPANELVFRDAQNDTLQGGVKWNPDSNLLNLTAVGYYSNNSVLEDEVDNPRTTDRSVATYGITIDNRSRFDIGDQTSLTFTYGGEYYRDQQTGLDTNNVDGTRGGVPDAQTEFYGLFIQADLAIRNLGPIPGEISIIPGIRWDSFESSAEGEIFRVDDNEFSPKIGISYKPIPQLLFFGNLAQGFRAPSFNEAFADGVHFTVPNLAAPVGQFGPPFVSNLFIGNDGLSPEESDSYEIGIGLDFRDLLQIGDNFTFKGSYFNSQVDNLIGLDVNTPLGCFAPIFAAIMPCGTGAEFGNISQNINIANAQIDGYEIEFSYDSDIFYARGNYSSIDGVDLDNGEFLEGVLTPDTIFLDIGAKIQSANLRIGTRTTYAAEFTSVNQIQDVRGNYLVSDIYVIWNPTNSIRIDVGVDNVSDADFEVVNAGVSQPGRNFKAAISWSAGF